MTTGDVTTGNAVEGKPPLDFEDERLLARGRGIGGALSHFGLRIRGGELGSLPIIVGLALVWGIFEASNSVFLSSLNLANLAIDSAAEGTIAVGVVLVLLVGEIDLSVGSMSGVASSILGIGLVQHGWPLAVAILVALGAGLLVGLVYAIIFVRFHVPSFVITLAGLLALLGFQLQLVGQTGSINISFSTWIVRFMEEEFLPHSLSYALAAVVAVGYASSAWARARRRRRAGLSARPFPLIVISAAILLVALELACWYMNRGRGISDAFVFFVALVVIMDFILMRTRWGRSVYAVGGSVEAARRAGIKVNRIYLSVFALCSMFAALGGLLAAGRLATASIASGTGDVNLNAIAAAVIGGTSLFGGRGRAYSALLGIAVIQSISNGLDLVNLSTAARFMITGGVLIVAVIADSASHRARVAHGHA